VNDSAHADNVVGVKESDELAMPVPKEAAGADDARKDFVPVERLVALVKDRFAFAE
jgi:hypothetical protein